MLFWKGGRSKSRKTGSLQTWPISAIRMKILNLVLKKRWDLLKIFFIENWYCLILWLSIATQLSTNSPFAWNPFSFLDEQKNRCIFCYKLMKWVKSRYIDKWNNCVIDFYQLINRYQFLLIYQLMNGFTNFYRLTTPGSSLM